MIANFRINPLAPVPESSLSIPWGNTALSLLDPLNTQMEKNGHSRCWKSFFLLSSNLTWGSQVLRLNVHLQLCCLNNPLNKLKLLKIKRYNKWHNQLLCSNLEYSNLMMIFQYFPLLNVTSTGLCRISPEEKNTPQELWHLDPGISWSSWRHHHASGARSPEGALMGLVNMILYIYILYHIIIYVILL